MNLKWKSNYRCVVSAHPYCTCKSTCHIMQRARALSTKMNNDRADGHCCIDLIGFNFLGRSVTPTFLSRYRLYLQFHIVQKWTKKQCRKLQKIQDFCPRDMESCGWKAREIMIVTCELVLWGTSPIRLIGPFKPYLAQKTSLQSSNCNIMGLAATLVFFTNKARFTQI